MSDPKPTARERLLELIHDDEASQWDDPAGSVKEGAILAMEAAEERVRKLAGRNLGNDDMFGHAARAIRSLLEEVRNA